MTTPVPDVTVIVPVYNTMPYLTACLDSLVAQSIGRERLQVITVDDGSTDGGGEQLDRYAERHPGLFTVLHQANSGGPAGPCNRGLELAQGRYVFFLGADDYLADRALEKLVGAADDWGSDVIWGLVEGVGGRGISQRLFGSTEKDIPFPHSDLPYALANSKMFRRSMIEEHRIRYALDLRIGSDQPFTVEAMLHARRISVLADEPYYYGVRREDATNISFSTAGHDRLRAIDSVMDHIAGLVPPGPDRDAIFQRHFRWEIAKRLREEFLALTDTEQQALCATVAAMADKYLTDRVAEQMPVRSRLRVRLAQAGELDDLVRVIEFDQAEHEPALALRAEQVCVALPGFGAHPDEWYAARDRTKKPRQLAGGDTVRLTQVEWQGRTLMVSAQARLHPVGARRVRLALAPVNRKRGIRPARWLRKGTEQGYEWPVEFGSDDTGPERRETATTYPITARADLTPLIEHAAGSGRRWELRFRVDVRDRTYDLPAEGAPGTHVQVRVGTRFFRLAARRDEQGRMFVVRRRMPRHVGLRNWVAARLAR
ncbi:MAG TPA: glycosyltransferase [Nocardioidaceae bacterium]|nr:glycosyltransferase [Nocardioidaceae bacterium]